MRNMSFALTTDQFRADAKSVTRRFGWWFLRPGDRVRAVVKSMGLRKGEHMEALGVIEIISTGPHRLGDMDQAECDREGFPHLSPDEFVAMLADHYGGDIDADSYPNRIEFHILEHATPEGIDAEKETPR